MEMCGRGGGLPGRRDGEWRVRGRDWRSRRVWVVQGSLNFGV